MRRLDDHDKILREHSEAIARLEAVVEDVPKQFDRLHAEVANVHMKALDAWPPEAARQLSAGSTMRGALLAALTVAVITIGWLLVHFKP